MHSDYGTTKYFKDGFKEVVMNNLVGMDSLTLSKAYIRYEKEIHRCVPQNQQLLCLINLEKAYAKIREELFGEYEQ